ncbi:phasin family protein [Roseiterribacter gracilis]|uniref:Phasin domain-containing protein n=1 Tax=Roseiterribacter gracilis TaxID=2812848 RepID=A0A8S8XA64_9PROT|nr:hypothetical protein TMPK1_02730 [Rhodospirillales bacterium TMPK1]
MTDHADNKEAIRAANEVLAKTANDGAAVIADAVTATVHQTLDAAQQLDETVATLRDAATDAAVQVGETANTAIAVSADAVARSVDTSQQVLAETADAIATQRARVAHVATDRVDALLDSVSAVTHGMEEMRQTWVRLAKHAFDEAARGPQELLQCGSLHDVAELHRAKLKDAMETTAQASRAMFDISTRIAREAVRPLTASRRAAE